ncbi:DUF6194 family protein [Caldimonas brevitalea]|uniref:DUF6194 domain-containing protein n=1 Tax=Caldimonas brevitalea TaxID=413882 RepID=A0A0G3BWA7_9BURK|nr:DUF6194 family protein [Caldimonas brevitalea]AKJ30785.1 hypothetical protein AAW51_4094 [Caldimonas brevitalea]
MTQDDIRAHLASHPQVHVLLSAPGDGTPEMAWGDTFFSIIDATTGEPGKMPFATIVIKDYGDFDNASALNRGGLYRLNVEVGREKFEQLFGFKPAELEAHRGRFDFTEADRLFPHPAYGSSGWVSIINPAASSRGLVTELLDGSRDRALQRSSR